MTERLRGFSDLFLFFGPDASARDIQKGAQAGAARLEVDNMHTLAQPRTQTKVTPSERFGDIQITRAKAESPRAAGAAEPAGPGYRLDRHITMSVDEWCRIPENPRQRDTDKHARKATKAHLRAPDPTHALVSMAELPDGSQYKVDGHTRALLWSECRLEAPPLLTVAVWACADEASVERIYNCFDAASAAETAGDKVQGAARTCRLAFETPMLREGCYATAVKRAYLLSHGNFESWKSPEYIYLSVAEFRDELAKLDLINPQPSRFPSGIITAALLTLKRRRGETKPPRAGVEPSLDDVGGLAFWDAYARGAGSKNEGEYDAVQALEDALNKAKKVKGTGSGAHLQAHMIHCGVAAHEAHRLGRTFGKTRRGFKPFDADQVRAYARLAAEPEELKLNKR